MKKIKCSSFLSSHYILLYIFFILCIIRNAGTYSQTDSLHQKKWSIGLYGGALVPTFDFSEIEKVSPVISITAAYRIHSHFDVYIKGVYNSLNFKQIYYFEPWESPTILKSILIETTVGIKYYISKSESSLYLNAGIGNYYWETQYKSPSNEFYKNISNYFGNDFGIGYSYTISKNFEIDVGTDYNIINTPSHSPTFTCLTFYVGVNFKF